MMTTKPNWQAAFKAQAEMDCEDQVDLALSGMLPAPSLLPAAISEAAWIRMEQILQGNIQPAEVDCLLRPVLSRHLNISQWHSRVWLNPNPTLEEVEAAWTTQAEEMERWSVFTSTFNTFKDIQKALKYAYQEYPYQSPTFENQEARHLWLTLLKNEQQDFVNGPHTAVIEITQGQALPLPDIKLEATHARLLDLLWPGEAVSVNSLLLDLFGQRSATPENKSHLSKRISELNKKLTEEWGAPVGKRWINRSIANGHSVYQLTKPKERL